jgi:hypothetical protein
VINEIAQWGVLLFMSVFVVGLTRHLGQTLMPPRQQYAHDQGPALGETLPLTLVDAGEQAALSRLIAERRQSFALLVMLHDSCPGCTDLIERLERGTFGRELGDAPIVAMTRSSQRHHVATLQGLADIVVVDAERFVSGGFRFTPFIMIVDAELRVVHKDLSSDLAGAIRRWRPAVIEEAQPTLASEVSL